MGLGSEFSKKASAHLHCIEVLREYLYGKLGKDVHRVFCPSKAGWQIGSPFLEGPEQNKQAAGIPAWDVFCREQVGGGREKGD